MSSQKLLLASVVALVAVAEAANAQGVLIPTDPRFRPCTISYQRINAVIHDQAAETRIEQEFRNDTSTALEAYYMFPIPDKAAVKDFAMTVDGKRVKGEVVEAPKARQIYEDIVRRTRDPGLLEYMGKNLWRVRVFPVPANGKQKFELTYTEIVSKDAGIASYNYPLKASGPTARVDGFFAVRLELHSTAALKSVYSPTHSVGVSREGDHKAIVGFEETNSLLNRDFQVFWTSDDRDVGLSLIASRESGGDPGYFMALISPKVEQAANEKVPRDVVFVLDTSGSMREDKMAQARKALEFCIKALDSADRFGVMSFATTVNHYSRELKKADKASVDSAVEWVRKLEAGGGTAISDALESAFKMRTTDARNFTIVFLTDGQPTIGETDPQAILKSTAASTNEGTRIFTFGVGDDVNTHLLDQLADQSRAVSTYVRPKEDLEVKVSAFFDKIRRPVLTNLSLDVVGDDKRLSDVFPPKLPDLFHGGQLVVMGRYTGSGNGTIRLKGKVGDKEKEFNYTVAFPEQRREADFLPSLWARRKIGYLLDQIRLKGETAELRDEVVFLAKRHGIATPYTSYLVVPDGPQVRGPVAGMPRGGFDGVTELSARAGATPQGGFGGGGMGGALGGRAGGLGGGGGGLGRSEEAMATVPLAEGSRSQVEDRFSVPGARGDAKDAAFRESGASVDSRSRKMKSSEAKSETPSDHPRGITFGRGIDGSKTANFGVPISQTEFDSVDFAMKRVAEQNDLAKAGKPDGTGDKASLYKQSGQWNAFPEAGEKAVNLSIALNKLKESQNRDAVQAVRSKGSSHFLAVGQVWVDKAYREGLKVIRVKYLSEGYFDLVAKLPGAKDVFSLGPQLVWKTPSGAALVIDNTGAEKLSDDEWKLLLTVPKPEPTEKKK